MSKRTPDAESVMRRRWARTAAMIRRRTDEVVVEGDQVTLVFLLPSCQAKKLAGDTDCKLQAWLERSSSLVAALSVSARESSTSCKESITRDGDENVLPQKREYDWRQ